MFHIRSDRKSKRKDRKGKSKNRYQAIINVMRNGRKFYKAKTFDSQRDAEKWGRDFLVQIDNGMITKESLKKRKLSDAIDKYISQVLPHKPRNAKNVTQHLNWWKNQLGCLGLSDINSSVIAEYRDRLLSESGAKGIPRSSTTVVRYLASLSIVFEYCVKEWLWITQNPVRSIRKPSVSKGKTRFFSLEDIEIIRKLSRESDSPFLFPIFVIALHTGMRKGELLALRWSNIDFKNKEIYFGRT